SSAPRSSLRLEPSLPVAVLLGGPQNPQVPPPPDLHALADGLAHAGAAGPARLADRVGQRLEIVGARRGAVGGQAHHLPPPGGGEPFGVFGTQVVTVRLGVRRQGAENCGRVGVNVREREDGRLTAGGAGTAADGAHGGTVSGKGAGRHYLSALKERVATIRTPVAGFPPTCTDACALQRTPLDLAL